MVRQGLTGTFGLLGEGRGGTGSRIRSWNVIGKKAHACPGGAHQPGSRFCESGHAAASSSRGADPSKERNRCGDESRARVTRGTVSASTHLAFTIRATHVASH